MIKINEVREALYNHLGHNEFSVNKYTIKHDNKKGYSVVVYGFDIEYNKIIPSNLFGKGMQVRLIKDEVDKGFLAGKALGFRSYEVLA